MLKHFMDSILKTKYSKKLLENIMCIYDKISLKAYEKIANTANTFRIQLPKRFRIAIDSPGCLKRSRPTPSQRRNTSFFNK